MFYMVNSQKAYAFITFGTIPGVLRSVPESTLEEMTRQQAKPGRMKCTESGQDVLGTSS